MTTFVDVALDAMRNGPLHVVHDMNDVLSLERDRPWEMYGGCLRLRLESLSRRTLGALTSSLFWRWKYIRCLEIDLRDTNHGSTYDVYDLFLPCGSETTMYDTLSLCSLHICFRELREDQLLPALAAWGSRLTHLSLYGELLPPDDNAEHSVGGCLLPRLRDLSVTMGSLRMDCLVAFLSPKLCTMRIHLLYGGWQCLPLMTLVSRHCSELRSMHLTFTVSKHTPAAFLRFAEMDAGTDRVVIPSTLRHVTCEVQWMGWEPLDETYSYFLADLLRYIGVPWLETLSIHTNQRLK